MIHKMIELQDRMNSKINIHWRSAGSAWMRAVAVEGVEGLESLGWKWWKKQEPDLQNMRMELIDIWHFIISEAIVHHGDDAVQVLSADYDTTLAWAFDSKSVRMNISELPPRERWDLLIGFAALRAPLYQVITIFRTLMTDVGLSNEALYHGYTAKNVLNFFRQDHGYKAGTYDKLWFGEEDNVWLERISVGLKDAGTEITEATLYAALSSKYSEWLATYADGVETDDEELQECESEEDLPETVDDDDVEVADDELTRKAYFEEMGARESMAADDDAAVLDTTEDDGGPVDDAAPDNSYALKG